MIALSATQRDKLARLLALLGSNFAGERDAAGLAAHRLVSGAGLTWQQALTPSIAAPAASSKPRAQPEPEPEDDWRALAKNCLNYSRLITAWECEFLEGLPRFPRLSERQDAVLQKIAAKLRKCGCEV
jgi:hypothetical protein